jgi:hypothetical protein
MNPSKIVAWIRKHPGHFQSRDLKFLPAREAAQLIYRLGFRRMNPELQGEYAVYPGWCVKTDLPPVVPACGGTTRAHPNGSLG